MLIILDLQNYITTEYLTYCRVLNNVVILVEPIMDTSQRDENMNKLEERGSLSILCLK